MPPRFEDFEIVTGYTQLGAPYATIRELRAIATGKDHADAIVALRKRFDEHIAFLQERGESIPQPGAEPKPPEFAPTDRVDAVRPFLDEFWQEILGQPLSWSFVSNESTLEPWEHLVGGRSALIARVQSRYGVDITSIYDLPVWEVVGRVRAAAA